MLLHFKVKIVVQDHDRIEYMCGTHLNTFIGTVQNSTIVFRLHPRKVYDPKFLKDSAYIV